MDEREFNEWLDSRVRGYDKYLKGYPELKEWIRSYNSIATIEGYSWAIHEFFERSSLTPRSFLQLDPVEARNIGWKVIGYLMGEKRNERATHMKYALCSFYNFYNEDKGLKLMWKRRTHRVPIVLKKYASKKIPSHSEVYTIVDSCLNLRDKLIITLMYQTGLSLTALKNLNYGDVKYILEEDSLPMKLIITPKIEPKRFNGTIPYRIVLIDKDARDLLKKYCSEKHKDSKDDTPLFSTYLGTRLSRFRLWCQTRNAIKRSQILDPKRTWMYLIRDAYYNRLAVAMTKENTEYLMGHDLGIAVHYYDQHKEEIKEQYLKCHLNRGESKSIDIKNLEEKLEEERKKRILLEEKLGTDKIEELILTYLKETIPPQVYNLIKKKEKQTKLKSNPDPNDCPERR